MSFAGDASTRTFFVVEPDPVVSLDLVGTLQSAFPLAHVTSAAMIEEALRGLGSELPDRTSILMSASLATESTIGALRELIAKGAEIIMVGEGQSFGLPVSIVETPFTTDMILSVLA